MGFLNNLISSVFQKTNHEFHKKGAILGLIQMCESLYKELSQQFPNKDPHEYLVQIFTHIKVKSGAVRESDIGDPSISVDTFMTTLKPACLQPPICARALAYTLISLDETLYMDFITKDDFSTYYDEFNRYLRPLWNADNDMLRNLYCKYNKNIEHQRAMFEDAG
jgi:hypothetical protein